MGWPLLPARVKSIFARGHFFEALVREQLIAAGFVFAPPRRWSSPRSTVIFRVTRTGSSSPRRPCPESTSPPPVLGMQSPQRQNWRAVARDGLAKVFPATPSRSHFISSFSTNQSGARYLLSTAIAAKRCTFPLPFNEERAQQAIDRAAMIIAATRAGELLPRFTDRSQDWRCKICSHRERCWR